LFLLDALYFLMIGLLAGWLAAQKTHGRGLGLIGNLIAGVCGALVGGFLLRLLGFQTTNLLGSLITATLGAILCLRVFKYVPFKMVLKSKPAKGKGAKKKRRAVR
jgi:uncharacterized membrane protein YeaQ/YmgE (transglycosylase-associated protein family)